MLLFSESCERNRDPILDVLRSCFSAHTSVLEIGSGTGQHAVYFAARLPHLVWHPTERLNYLADLEERIALEGGPNVHRPAVLDVRQSVWPVTSVDAIFTANTLHIMSWPEVIALFRGVDAILEPGGSLCIYGPFLHEGRHTSPSNLEFDRMLRERDAESGIRDREAVSRLAAQIGLALLADHDLPAFNRLLVFSREGGSTTR